MELIEFNESYQDDIIALHQKALQSAGAYAGPGPWDDDLFQIRKIYKDNGGIFILGIDDGRLIAMGALKRIDASTAEITRMRVKPSQQRRGFGKQMLECLIQKAKALEYNRIILETSTVQTAAQMLYRKYGFTETHRGVLKGFNVIYFEKKFGSVEEEPSEGRTGSQIS